MAKSFFETIATSFRGRSRMFSPKKGTPMPAELTDEERANVPVWTGEKYEPYSVVKARGWRYVPGDQHLPTQSAVSAVNTAVTFNAVRVRRNKDGAEMTIPARAYHALKDSVDDQTGQKKLTVIEVLVD